MARAPALHREGPCAFLSRPPKVEKGNQCFVQLHPTNSYPAWLSSNLYISPLPQGPEQLGNPLTVITELLCKLIYAAINIRHLQPS